jgi:hypothetical protein
MAILRTCLTGVLLAVFAFPQGAVSQEKDASKSIFYCTGTIVTLAGLGPNKVNHSAATSVVLEIEAQRLVLLGDKSTAALKFLRVEESGSQTIYHFGGVADELVYKGTFSFPDFQLRVLGAGENLQIGITMNCDGNSPLRLF